MATDSSCSHPWLGHVGQRRRQPPHGGGKCRSANKLSRRGALAIASDAGPLRRSDRASRRNELRTCTAAPRPCATAGNATARHACHGDDDGRSERTAASIVCSTAGSIFLCGKGQISVPGNACRRQWPRTAQCPQKPAGNACGRRQRQFTATAACGVQCGGHVACGGWGLVSGRQRGEWAIELVGHACTTAQRPRRLATVRQRLHP